MSDRERAYRILSRLDERPGAAQAAIDREGGVEDRDFVRTLVFAVLRWRLRLDHAIGQLARRDVASIDPPVVRLLRLGTAQVWFTNVAGYAAVSETVTLAGTIAPRAKGFVNAVLRRATERSIESLDPKDDSVGAIAVRTSHPEWLVERWATMFGRARAAEIAAADQELSYPDLLVNVKRWSVDDAAEELGNRGVAFERSLIDSSMLRLRESTARVADLIRKGRVYAMDEGSAAIASLFPRGCGRVLDLAAAPGGKTLALALAGHRVVSHDIAIGRIQPLRRAHSVMFGRAARIAIGDGTHPPFRNGIDAVLVDAPCSATGTLRKNPEARWRLSPDRIESMTPTQEAILDAALSLSPGYCLYATCSLEPEENDAVVDRVLAAHGGYERIDLAGLAEGPIGDWIESGTLRLTPESGADGFTAIGIARKN
ncbi:MAG: transcription antitermination factor NusB [Thermoanaerobaculia bacterium]